MKIQGIISAVILAIALSVPAFAASAPIDADVLYKNANFNKNLVDGDYYFAKNHSRYGSKFQDSWKFTVAENTAASISIFDTETKLTKQSAIRPSKMRQLRQRRGSISTAKIFDTTHLTLSLFDNKGKLIGATGENGTLNLDLLAGKWYTLKVTGKVNGLLGSRYYGSLHLNPEPAPVPVGGAGPLLGSALGLLALRLRKRLPTSTKA